MQQDPANLLSQLPRQFGTRNPERMINPHWEWMVRNRAWPTKARECSGIPNDVLRSSYANRDPDYPYGTPDWCFAGRYGQTRTKLPDGRVICIAGEFEDWYDVDFCIYNDVVVLRPALGAQDVTPDSGDIEIYGYPAALFPPTDFHSASLVSSGIYLIGCLGYEEHRAEHLTPVFLLDTNSFRIDPVTTTGACPGWIHGHHAMCDAASGSISVRGGVRLRCGQFEANQSAFRLHLSDGRWECVADIERHRHFLLEGPPFVRERYPVDARVFLPTTIECTPIESSPQTAQRTAFDVNGVRVVVNFMHLEIRVLIEGELQEDAVRAILSHVQEVASTYAESKWSAIEIEGCGQDWIDDFSGVMSKFKGNENS